MLIEKPLHLKKDLTTTQEEVLSSNPGRYYALLVNNSDTNCAISLGVPAVIDEGIPLTPNGSYEINLTNPFHGAIYAVSAGATKRLNITEITHAT